MGQKDEQTEKSSPSLFQRVVAAYSEEQLQDFREDETGPTVKQLEAYNCIGKCQNLTTD